MESAQARRPSRLSAWSGFAGTAQSRVVDLLITNGVGVALVVSAVLLLSRVGSVLAAVGAAVGVTSLLLLGWVFNRLGRRRTSMLAVLPAQRLVLLVALAGGYLFRVPGDPGWIWTATGLAMVVILVEPTLRQLLGRASSMAFQLPGVPTVNRPPFPPGRVALLPLVEVAVGTVLAAVGAPGWCYLVVVLLGTVVALAMFAYAARSLLASRQIAVGVGDALAAYAPEFAVYYAARNGATYQLGMWLPYLERLNKRFVVITVHGSTVNEIQNLTSAPILVPRARTANGRLVHLVVPSLRAAFYVQNHPQNLNLQRFEQLTHIWLNHGDSDKAANYSAQHATFDKIFVSGQQGVDRYAAHGVRIRPDQFEVVGRPQIEQIEVRDHPLDPEAPRTVLYAPTWQGGQPATNYSSLPLGGRIVAALLDRGTTVIFRPHPHSYRDPTQVALIRQIHSQLETDQRSTGRTHVWGAQAETGWDIPACFNHSDALITDVSSVASDFLASGKPLAMVAIRNLTIKSFRRDVPMARVAYVVKPDLSTLDAALDDLLGSDPLAPARHAYRTQCLGDALGPHAADQFLATAGALVAGQPPVKAAAVDH